MIRKLKIAQRFGRSLAVLAGTGLVIGTFSSGNAIAAGQPDGDDVGILSTGFNGVCEATELCLYRDKDLHGYVIDYPQGASDSTYNNNDFPGTNLPVNDQISSWFNRSNRHVCIYDNSNYGGNGQHLPPNGGHGNMDDTSVGGDDASSHRVVSGTAC